MLTFQQFNVNKVDYKKLFFISFIKKKNTKYRLTFIIHEHIV